MWATSWEAHYLSPLPWVWRTCSHLRSRGCSCPISHPGKVWGRSEPAFPEHDLPSGTEVSPNRRQEGHPAMHSLDTRKSRASLFDIAAGILIAAAVCLRLSLVHLGWPDLNSDEGTMGLMARHIIHNGEHPIYFYGQAYMGALEAYLGAALFPLFGATSTGLRLGLVALFALFLVSMY